MTCNVSGGTYKTILSLTTHSQCMLCCDTGQAYI